MESLTIWTLPMVSVMRTYTQAVPSSPVARSQSMDVWPGSSRWESAKVSSFATSTEAMPLTSLYSRTRETRSVETCSAPLSMVTDPSGAVMSRVMVSEATIEMRPWESMNRT